MVFFYIKIVQMSFKCIGVLFCNGLVKIRNLSGGIFRKNLPESDIVGLANMTYTGEFCVVVAWISGIGKVNGCAGFDILNLLYDLLCI